MWKQHAQKSTKNTNMENVKISPEELKYMLKENLSLSLDIKYGYEHGARLQVSLIFDGEEIVSDYISLYSLKED